jgi:hypothetical protein
VHPWGAGEGRNGVGTAPGEAHREAQGNRARRVSPEIRGGVVERIGPAGLSRRQAARELAIGYATLKRLLDARIQPAEQQSAGGPSLPPAADYCGDANAWAEEVLH